MTEEAIGARVDHNASTGGFIAFSSLAPLVDTQKENGGQCAREGAPFVYCTVQREKARQLINSV
jgi:hypothetical protein